MREHGAEGDITNAANVGDLGAVLLVDDHAAAFVKLETNVFQAQPLRVGTTADRDQDDVSIEL